MKIHNIIVNIRTILATKLIQWFLNSDEPFKNFI